MIRDKVADRLARDKTWLDSAMSIQTGVRQRFFFLSSVVLTITTQMQQASEDLEVKSRRYDLDNAVFRRHRDLIEAWHLLDESERQNQRARDHLDLADSFAKL